MKYYNVLKPRTRTYPTSLDAPAATCSSASLLGCVNNDDQERNETGSSQNM